MICPMAVALSKHDAMAASTGYRCLQLRKIDAYGVNWERMERHE
jgi:hypothetical protein